MPQGHPRVDAGRLVHRGREFAARWAEAIFTVQQEKRQMQDIYADMKARVAAAGRDPRHCAVLPAIDVIVAETERRRRPRPIMSIASPASNWACRP